MCVPCANLQLISNNQAIASSRQWQNSFEVNAVAYGKQVKLSFAVAVKGEEVEPVRYHHHRSSVVVMGPQSDKVVGIEGQPSGGRIL